MGFGGGGKVDTSAQMASIRRQEEALRRQEEALARREAELKAQEEARRRARQAALLGRVSLLGGLEVGTQDAPEPTMLRRTLG